MRRFLTSIDKRGNKIPSQNRTGYLSSPPPRPQSGDEIPVASSIPQSIFLHKTRQYFIDIWREVYELLTSCLFPTFDDTGYFPLDEYFPLGSGSAFRLSTTIV